MALLTALFIMGSYALAADYGTADEAKAMLERAVAAMNADQAKALAEFTAGAPGFKEKDLYVFCGGPDGNFSAHGAKAELVGKSLKGLKDKADKAVGEEMYAKAAEGSIVEVEYMWPRPGETEPVTKVSEITKVGDQICGVGYYKS
ncbi:MAG: cache domain-containing protein [Gammaproteobacteria bacterium]|nr:cache domain-containing protein [Gammaproteobacteria bacterium]MCP5458794.1 cache domain-containing protein [Gammaproteobacteria bacterium]